MYKTMKLINEEGGRLQAERPSFTKHGRFFDKHLPNGGDA
jgi:hypothetical protein